MLRLTMISIIDEKATAQRKTDRGVRPSLAFDQHLWNRGGRPNPTKELLIFAERYILLSDDAVINFEKKIDYFDQIRMSSPRYRELLLDDVAQRAGEMHNLFRRR